MTAAANSIKIFTLVPMKWVEDGNRDFDYRPIVPLIRWWSWSVVGVEIAGNSVPIVLPKNEIKREYVWNVGSFALGLPLLLLSGENEFQFLIIKLHCIFIGPMFYEL